MESRAAGDGSVTAAEIVVDLLARAGVREVFGVAGSTIMPILDAIADDDRIRYVPARYEQSAADMASGYARASGRLGVVMTHVGPGATSCLTTMVAAGREGVPLLLLTGNEESATLVREPYHDWGLAQVMPALVQFSQRVHQPRDLPHVLRRAFGQAARAVPQPVHVDLPEDVALTRVPRAEAARWYADVQPVADELASPVRLPVSRPAPRSRDVARVAELLAGATSPLLVLGEAVRWSEDPQAVYRRCAELGIPYASTHGGRGGIGAGPWHVGSVGRFGSQAATAMLGAADLVVALGAEISDVDTVGWRSLPGDGGSLVLVHPDARKLDLRVAPDIGVVTDIGEFVAALAGELGAHELAVQPEWLARAEATDGSDGQLGDGQRPLDAELVERVLGSVPDSWAVAVDPGFGSLTLTSGLRVGGPFLYPFGFGYMGFAVPHAIGAVVSGAVEGAVAVLGDGAFFMSMAAVESVASLRVPVVLLVLDDGGFGSQRQKQREGYGRNFGVDYENPDIAAVAAALGLEARWVDDQADIDDVCTALPGRAAGMLIAVRRAKAHEIAWYEGSAQPDAVTARAD
ncbi:MAG: hypothetical protein GEV07_30280 [Streptosporangiales bacterium]|nr:hypothetical protein [Streptosporangiales bacterium]